MNQRLTKLNLLTHLTFSIGWTGAIFVFVVLAVTGLNSINPDVSRSMYLAMDITAWYIIVPFCIASLITGIVQATGTNWGLFNYYWITVKLFLTIAATIALLFHMQPIEYLSGLASENPAALEKETSLRIQLIADAGAAILLLTFITGISIYKPWGKLQLKKSSGMNRKKGAGFYLLILFIVLLAVVIIKHLLDGGLSHH